MSRLKNSNDTTSRLGAVVLQLALALACLDCGIASAADQAPGAQAPKVTVLSHQSRRRSSAQTVEARVQLLTRQLDLDAKQQGELGRLLERERQQGVEVRRSAGLSAVDRVHAAEALHDRTDDQIRALLNEEQKKKYPARPPRQTTKPAQPDLEQWMRLTRPKTAQAEGKPE